jgi:dye decolorizing peroxidase
MTKVNRLLAVVAAGGIFAAGGFTALQLATTTTDFGVATEPFYGEHQNGIETARQANSTYVAFDINEGIDKAAVGRMMRVLTTDASLLTQGKGIIGDSQFEMATNPARLTITFGFGYSLFEKIGATSYWPSPERKIPAYSIDKLEKQWSDGDFLIQAAGDDSSSIFHAVHELARDVAPFATIRWQQRGFSSAAGVNVGNDPRSLFGQVDGTANARIGTPDFDERTWSLSPKNFVGGSTMVIRRIRFNFGTWDRLSANKKNASLGRKLSDGSPLSGGDLQAPLNFEAKNKDGSYSIPEDAHVRNAFTENNRGITRRGANYDDNYLTDGTHDAGLIFTSFQAELSRFLAIQSSLAEVDSLNRWTTPVGSAFFIIPPGVEQGDWVGRSLLG